jgi:signal transduction histidine kinase
VLVARSPWFGFFCWIGYTHAFRYLTGVVRYAGLVVIAAASALAQLGGFHTPTAIGVTIWLVVTLLNATLVTTFIYLGQKAEDQNQARKQMVADLAAANKKLEEMMAENTGLHAQLLTQAREAGVLEERQRMAREIHDTLAQGLTGIITQLEAVQQSGAGPDWERRIANAARLARHSLTEARRSVRAVRPEPLENTRLPEAVADVAAQWSADNGVRAEVTTTGTVLGLHPELEVTLLRVAQEALTNVAKHASASRVGITLSYMEDVVSLDIRDDGAGFRPDQRVPAGSAGGFGLTGMEQRVRRLAGSLAIESEPGRGTAISASVPAIPRADVTTMETVDE